MAFSVSLSLVKVNFIQQSIDAILVKDINKLFKVGSLFIGITFFRLIYDYIYGNHYKKIFVYMEKDLKIVFAFKLLKSKMKEIDHEKSGDLNIKSSSDIPNSLEFIKQIFSNFILNPIMTLAGFFYLFFYNWKLSILVFIPIPILAILLNKLSSRSSYLYKSMQELNSIYSDGIYDTIHGMETIKAYNMQGMQIQKLRKVLYKILEETKKYDVNSNFALE